MFLCCQRPIGRMLQERSPVLDSFPNYFHTLPWEHFPRAIFVGDVSRHEEVERESSSKMFLREIQSQNICCVLFCSVSRLFIIVQQFLKWWGSFLPETVLFSTRHSLSGGDFLTLRMWEGGTKAESSGGRASWMSGSWMLASCSSSVPYSHNSLCMWRPC